MMELMPINRWAMTDEDDVDVLCDVGLDGFKIMNSEGTESLHAYTLYDIRQWSWSSTMLILHLEEKNVRLSACEDTVKAVAEVLLVKCHQLAK